MANYNVDIEVALRGARELKVLKDSLKGVNKEVGRLNAATIKAGKALRGTFSAKDIGNVNNYSKAVAKAERALRNAAFGTEAEKKAVKALVTAQKEFNEQLDRQNKLLREEERLQSVNQPAPKTPKTRRPGTQTFGVSGIDFMPIGGGEFVPGSPLFKQGLQRRAGAAVSAGAFPLLFGGGPGMALGGAIGGAAAGATFGPAAIALQVLGGALDQFAATAAATGQALNPLTADVNAVAQAAGYANTPFEDLFVSLENNGDAAEALRLATELMAVTVGTNGANALRDFGANTLELSTEFQKAMAVMQAALASFISKTGILQGIAGGIERFNLRGQIRGTLQAGGANAERLEKTLGPVSFDTGEREFTAATYDLMRKINEEKEKGIKLEAENASLLSSAGIIAANNKKIAELDADLTNHRVFTLEKSNIMQEAILAKTKEGANTKLIDIERDTKLLDLQNRKNAQIEAANDKAERAAKRQSDAADRLAKKQQRAIDRRVEAVERELERTEKLFDRAGSQLDALTNKHKDKVAFEKEYSRLIEQGSTPAAAKQAIELKKQLLELDRGYKKLLEALDAQIAKTETSILELRAQKGVTTEYEDQVRALDELKKRKAELEGKREGAEGAINEALAPKTDRENLEAYLEKLQEQLNDLMNPANQLIGLAETLGGAFSESFKGLVSGSMSAQEALANLFQRTADHFLDMAAQMIAAQIKMQILGIGLNFLGGGFGGGGGLNLGAVESYSGVGANTDVSGLIPRANGGPVGAGQPYLVGERGPELFVPGAQGNIVPNNAMGGANIVVNVDASGTQAQGDQPNAKALGAAIGAAVQAELVRQKRPGGLLSS